MVGDTECFDIGIPPCEAGEGVLYVLRVSADDFGSAPLNVIQPPDLDLFAETIDVTDAGTVSIGCRSRSAEDMLPGRLSVLTRRELWYGDGVEFNLTRFVGDVLDPVEVYPKFNGLAAADGISYVLGTTLVEGSGTVASVVFAANSRNGDGVWATALTCPSGVVGGDLIMAPDAFPLVAVTSDLPGWSQCTEACMTVLKLDIATGAVRHTRFIPSGEGNARLATTLIVQETDPDISTEMRVFVLGDVESDSPLTSNWGLNAGAVRIPREEIVATGEDDTHPAPTLNVNKEGKTLAISLWPRAGMRALLFDVSGRLIADGRTSASELHLALPETSGLYFLRVAHENQVLMRRVTVVR